MLSHPAQYAPSLGVQLPAFASLRLLCSCWSQLCACVVPPGSSYASSNHPVQCKPKPPCVMLMADVCSAWLVCGALQRFISGLTPEGLHVYDVHVSFCVGHLDGCLLHLSPPISMHVDCPLSYEFRHSHKDMQMDSYPGLSKCIFGSSLYAETLQTRLLRAMFLGTLPMGLATIVTGVVLFGVPCYAERMVVAAWVLWWIDVSLTLLISFGIPFIMCALPKPLPHYPHHRDQPGHGDGKLPHGV